MDSRVVRADMSDKLLHGLQLIKPDSTERLSMTFHHAKCLAHFVFYFLTKPGPRAYIH